MLFGREQFRVLFLQFFYESEQFVYIHCTHLSNVLVSDAVTECLLVEPLTVTFGTLNGNDFVFSIFLFFSCRIFHQAAVPVFRVDNLIKCRSATAVRTDNP